MGNEKYIFVKNEPDTQSSYLSRQGGGGAVIANLKTGIVIGIWHKDQMMSKGGAQNQFECAMSVEKMGTFLRELNY